MIDKFDIFDRMKLRDNFWMFSTRHPIRAFRAWWYGQ